MIDERVFTPESFGAVADGFTDDGEAIGAAVTEAVKCGGTVKFAGDKTYFIRTPSTNGGPVKAGLALFGAKGVTLKGENTTIRIGSVFEYFSVFSCSNITIDGFIFESFPHVSFRGKLVSVCHEKVSAVIKTDYEILGDEDAYNYCDFENGKGRYAFAMPDDRFRKHLYLRRIEKTGNKNEYTVWFDKGYDTRDALHRVEFTHCDIIMPTPRFGHRGQAFFIHSSKDIHIQNCNVREAAQFVGVLKGNSGDIYFDNVKMCSEKDQTVPMVGWRDGYHCKDNRGAIHWNNCDIGKLYDDAFNISCSNLIIVDQPEPDVLSLKHFENNGCYYPVKQGDTLTVCDVFRGILYGEELKVKEVIRQQGPELLVRLESAIPQVDIKHTRAMFSSLSAPNSTIENCRVTGTVRIRCPATIKGTSFEDLLVMWIENEQSEGPVPRDILFEKCSFNGVYPVTGRYLNNPVSFRTTMSWPGIPQYKLKNIRLVNCKFDSKEIYIEDGNDVKISD